MWQRTSRHREAATLDEEYIEYFQFRWLMTSVGNETRLRCPWNSDIRRLHARRNEEAPQKETENIEENTTGREACEPQFEEQRQFQDDGPQVEIEETHLKIYSANCGFLCSVLCQIPAILRRPLSLRLILRLLAHHCNSAFFFCVLYACSASIFGGPPCPHMIWDSTLRAC